MREELTVWVDILCAELLLLNDSRVEPTGWGGVLEWRGKGSEYSTVMVYCREGEAYNLRVQASIQDIDHLIYALLLLGNFLDRRGSHLHRGIVLLLIDPVIVVVGVGVSILKRVIVGG